MIRGKRTITILILLFLISPQISSNTKAAVSYEIEAYSNQIIEFTKDVSSLFIIEIDNSLSGLKYNIDIKNQLDFLVTSRDNYTENLVITFIGTGTFELTIGNPNNQQVEIYVSIESFKLVVNDEIGGFSYKNKIFCWSFNSGSIINYKIFSIESIKRGYYNLYFSVKEQDISATFWLSDTHPSQDPYWNEYLDSIYMVRNKKVLVDVEETDSWLVTDIFTPGSFEIVVVLRSTVPGYTFIIIVGISAVVIGIIIFVLYYLDPLKYRKRKVEGKDYKSVKSDFEQPEDIEETLADLMTNSKEKK